ncbi:tetratricopeptide repeat domain-containing protein [Apiospora marii]|uniref:tetratricopeptide repeat domain-containing protein n=1 Tax=Apiospora marii TaxID=335849 RepID=UPI003131BA55
MEDPLKLVVRPERPDEYGLEIIDHDAELRIEDKFRWEDVQAKTNDLTNALRSWVDDEVKQGHGTRVFVFVGIGMAGYIVKHTLIRFSQESRFRRCLDRVQGLIFFGTPNFTESNERAASILSGILRYETGLTGRWPSNITKRDLSSLVHSAYRFDELKLGCHIMTCFEKIAIKTRKFGVSRQIAMVDRDLAVIPAARCRIVEIDTKLSSLLESTDCVVHRHISDFFGEVYNAAQGSIEDTTKKPDAVASQSGPGDMSICDPFVTMRAGTAERPLEPSLPIRAQTSALSFKVPEPSIIHSPSSKSFPSCGSPDSSAKLSTRQNLSSHSGVRSSMSPLSLSSESSYVLLPGANESKKRRAIQTPVEWVQAGSRRQPNPAFCGRSEVVTSMKRALLDSESKSILRPNVFVLCGPAGVGKTQTALHFFHSMKSEFDVRFWIQGDSTDGLFAAYREISVRLGLETRDDSQDAVLTRELVKGWFTEPYEHFKDNTGRLLKWLVVIDNADNPDDVLDFWPYDGQGSIIITSRNRGSMTQNYFSESGSELTSMTVDDAARLLQSLLENGNRPKESFEMLRTVVVKLECWPLAIAQMAGIICRRNLPLAKFLEIYDCRENRSKYQSQKFGKMDGYSLTLAAAWALDDMSPGAAQLLSVISLFTPASIPQEILTSTPERAKLVSYPLNAGDFYSEIEKIESCSIIAHRTGLHSEDPIEISIHPLIQEVVRGQLLHSKETIVSTFNAAVGLMTGVWPFETLPFYGFHDFDKIQRRDCCERLLPQVTQLVQFYQSLNGLARGECTTEDMLNLLSEIGWYQYQRLRMEDSLVYVQLTLRILDESPGDYAQIRAGNLGTWGNVALKINQADVALEKNLEALEIRKNTLAATGVVNSQIAASYTETAFAMIANGLFSEAEELIETSISLRKQMPKFSRLQLCSPLYYKAILYNHKGDYMRAAACASEALRDREMAYGPDDHENKRVGLLLTCLGNVYTNQGMEDQGFVYHQRALAQLLATGGEDDLDTAIAYYKVTIHYLRLGSLDLAASLDSILVGKAIRTFRASRFHHGELARALFLQARVYQKLGDSGLAASSLDECVAIRRQLVGNDSRPVEQLAEAAFDALVAIGRR